MNRILLTLTALLIVPSALAQQRPAFPAPPSLDDGTQALEEPPRYRAIPGTEQLVLTPAGMAQARAFAASKPKTIVGAERLMPGPASVAPPAPDLARGGAVFTVNGAGDRPDTNPGDGVCYTGILVTDGTLFADECTLRAAIEEANATVSTDPILIRFRVFAGPGGSEVAPGVWRITLAYDGADADTDVDPLPVISHPQVTVDALTQSGASCGDLVAGTPHDLRVVLDGSQTTGNINNPAPGSGLRSNRDIVVRGLVVQHFAWGFGIYLTASDALIECNYVGTDYTGEVAAGNGDGIYAGGTVRNNLVSGNFYYGIFPRPFTSGSTFSRNLVGSDDDGNEPLGNGRYGFYIASTDNVITTNLVAATSSISVGEGITLDEEPLFDSGIVASGNVLTNNTVGLTRTRGNGAGDMGNARVGIWLRGGAHDNDIGLPGNGNFIANHANENAAGVGPAAIRLDGEGTDDNRIRGNIIGLTASGNAAPNNNGVQHSLSSASGTPNGTVIGGSAPGAGNIIASSVRRGIYLIEATNVRIEGNTIGLSASGATRPNVEEGIFLDGSDTVTIRGNTISGNTGSGISLIDIASESGPSVNVLIEDNRIGTNAAGTAARPNGLSGIVLADAVYITVTGNVISGNTDTGLFLDGASDVIAEDNFIGTNGFGADLGNGLPGGAGRAGIYCQNASNVRIGQNFSPNTIRFNDADGLFVGPGCQDIASVGNIISSNGGLAVDHVPNGPNTSEVPVITSAENDGTNAVIGWTLSAEPNTTYELLFCRNTTPDPSGYGECAFPNALATTTTNGAGNASGTRTLGASAYPAGSFVTVNATEVEGALPAGYGRTSEFSAAVEVEDMSVEPGLFLTATNTSPLTVAPGGSVSFDFSVMNTTASAATGDLFFTVSPGGFSGIVTSGTVLAGQTVSGSFVQQVPGNAPAESYTYTLRIGQFPNTTVDAVAFTATVTGSARGGDGTQTWSVSNATPWHPVEEAPTAIAASHSEALPTEAVLESAYPNPFTHSTTLAFALPETQRVTLRAYDILGREVARLVDGELEAGPHESMLDAAHLPSGTYIVRLEAGGTVQTQRLTLLR